MADPIPGQNPVPAGVQPATLQTPVPVKNFAFLKHFWRPGPAAIEAELQPQFANPGFLTPTGVQVSRGSSPQKGLQDFVDDMPSAISRSSTSTSQKRATRASRRSWPSPGK